MRLVTVYRKKLTSNADIARFQRTHLNFRVRLSVTTESQQLPVVRSRRRRQPNRFRKPDCRSFKTVSATEQSAGTVDREGHAIALAERQVTLWSLSVATEDLNPSVAETIRQHSEE